MYHPLLGDVLTTQEFAKEVGVTQSTVFLWVKNARIKANKVGGRIYIPTSEVDRLRQEVKPTSKKDKMPMFIHTYKDGKICYQGHVLHAWGNKIEVQLYSWLDGNPTDVVMLPIDDTIRWYSNHADWIANGDRESALSRRTQ